MKISRSHIYLVWKGFLKSLISTPIIRKIQNDRDKMEPANKIYLPWPQQIKKPEIGLVKDKDYNPYWTKYERFLNTNDIPYKFYNIHKSNWLKKANKFDIILWRPCSLPAELKEARRKIHILAEYKHKLCYPDQKTIMLYEDKLAQYDIMRSLSLPLIPTFISSNYKEIMEKLPTLDYPLISKIQTSSGSYGIEMVKNLRAARKLTKKAFSRGGRRTYWPYENQKDYVCLQKYQSNKGYDLRIIVCGNYIFGYYRDVPSGEFRASGMNTVRKESLPEDAINLAIDTYKKLDHTILAVDMLRDKDNNLHIIEISSFIRIITSKQLKVNGTSGVYLRDEEGNYSFKEGSFWLQELVLKEFLQEKWISPRKDK